MHPVLQPGRFKKILTLNGLPPKKTLLKHLELQRQLLDEGEESSNRGDLNLLYMLPGKEENQNQVESFLARHTGFFMKKRPSDSAFFELDDWTNEEPPFSKY